MIIIIASQDGHRAMGDGRQHLIQAQLKAPRPHPRTAMERRRAKRIAALGS